MTEIKKHPGWKNALHEILSAFEGEGFGVTFEHSQLREWMDIPEPKKIEEVEKLKLKYLDGIDRLKDSLLHTHRLCLESKFSYGYELVHPNKQVSAIPVKRLFSAMRHIKRAEDTLQHVQEDMLDSDGVANMESNASRIAFLKTALKPRKTFALEDGHGRVKDDSEEEVA